MPSTSIPNLIIRTIADNHGKLTAAAFEQISAVAEREGLTGATKRALLQPERYLAVSPELRKANIRLEDIQIEAGALARAQELAKRLGTEAFPMLLQPRGKTEPSTKMEKAAAELRRALDRAEALGPAESWKVQTSGADVKFNVDVGGKKYPALVLDTPKFTDPAPRNLLADPAIAKELRDAKSAAAVKVAAEKLIAKEADYLAADGVGVKTKNERYGIQRLRAKALLDALPAAASALPAQEKSKLAGALAEVRESLIVNRDFPMEVGSHTNYWPYWSNYVRALVKIAGQTDASSPDYALINNRIRDIMRHKTVFGRQLQLDERDFERTANCALVFQPKYAAPPGHRVSLAKSSTEEAPAYELLSVAASGLPAELAKYAGTKVYRDQGRLFFDAEPAGKEVPAALAGKIVATPVSSVDDLSLRELRAGERARSGVSLDWDGSGAINVAKIFIGWWGHCHNESPLNAMGIDPKRSVELYREERTLAPEHASATFSSDDAWDIAGAFVSDAESGWSTNGVRADARVNDTAFEGERNNGHSRLVLALPGRANVSVDAEVVAVSEKNAPQRRVSDPMSLFRKNIPNGDGTFSANPDYAGARFDIGDRDAVAVDLHDRLLTVQSTFVTFDERGMRYEENRRVELDPSKDQAVMLSEEIVKRGSPRGGELLQHWYNAKTHEYFTADVAVKEASGGGGKYERTETGRSTPIKASNLVSVEESTYDSSQAIHEFVTANMGLPFTFDTDPGKAVWNYPVKFVRLDREKVERRNESGQEYSYTSYKMSYATMGGPTEEGSQHRYIIKRDAGGRAVDAIALDPMPDFAFRQNHWVSAPVALDARGRRCINLRAKEAGYLTPQGSAEIAPSLWKRQADVLYAAIRPQAKNEETAHIMELDDGSLIAFSDPIAFEAAKKADLKLRKIEAAEVATPDAGRLVA